MNNSLQTIINAVLGLAVAVLFFLHFSGRSASNAAKPAAVVATSPKPDSAATTADAPAPEAETAPATTDAAAPDLAGPSPATEGKIAYVGIQQAARWLPGHERCPQGLRRPRPKAGSAKTRAWWPASSRLSSSTRNRPTASPPSSAPPPSRSSAPSSSRWPSRQQQLQQQAQQEEAKLTSTVLERINKQVEAYGKARGYKLILIAAPSGTIAYGQKDLDITAPVLTYLNGEYHKK